MKNIIEAKNCWMAQLLDLAIYFQDNDNSEVFYVMQPKLEGEDHSQESRTEKDENQEFVRSAGKI